MGGTAALAMTGVGMLGSGGLSKASHAQNHQEELSQIARNQENETEQRLSELAKVSATHRARTAAQGINPMDGSSAAVLKGLEKKTLDQLQEQSVKYDAQRNDLRQTFSDVQDENLTERDGFSDLLFSDESLVRELKNWG